MKNNTNPLATIVEFKIEKKSMNLNLNDIVMVKFSPDNLFYF